MASWLATIQWKLNFGKKIIVLKNNIYSVYSIYNKIVIYSQISADSSGLEHPPPPPPNSLAAKFTSQGDAHMRTDAQIKFLYYPQLF